MRHLAWTIAGIAALLAAAAATAQPVWRCGDTYTGVPSSGCRSVDTQNSATAKERAASARRFAMQKRTADDMERDRLKQEAAYKPAAAGSLGPRAATAPAPGASNVKPNLKPKAKAKGKIRVVDGDDFVATVPKAKKTPKQTPQAGAR